MTDYNLTDEEYIDALLSYRKDHDKWGDDDWDDWGNKAFTGYGELLGGRTRDFAAVSNRTVTIMGHKFTLIHAEFTEPSDVPYAYGDESLFHQGYEGDGFIIFQYEGKAYRKNAFQNSYGNIRFKEDPPFEATQMEKIVNVWS